MSPRLYLMMVHDRVEQARCYAGGCHCIRDCRLMKPWIADSTK